MRNQGGDLMIGYLGLEVESFSALARVDANMAAAVAARALGLPSGAKAEIMLSVGYPDEAPPARKRKTMEEFASFNKYL